MGGRRSRLAVLTIVAVSAVKPAVAANGEVLGCVKLRPSAAYPDVRGRAELVTYPRHGEIDARFSGAPRREAYLAWLLPHPKDPAKAFLGGAVPGSRGFDGSFIVPGGHPVSERNTRAARKLVLTSTTLRQGRRIVRRYRADHYKAPHALRGTVLAKGGVQSVRETVCPRIPAPSG